MTSSAGAGSGRGGGAPERNMELQELARRVTKLQAWVRGRQTRRRLQSVKAEYEEVVRQLEGGPGGRLRWRGRWLPRPVFSPEPRLQRLRRHLAMEMLWLQQAIVSRKKYLLLRQTLDLPED